ncbi:MAG TPA: fructosamine kinase family protein [Chitinophagaceae bacterium]|nr:fructosamine kinase family protein [Chitinophagaceae bacterium]
MTQSLKDHIARLLSATTTPVYKPVGGGCINQTWQVTVGSDKFFCKINSASRYPGLFDKEAAGLKALSDTGCIRCPSVISVSQLNDEQVLLMEWIETGSRHHEIWVQFGKQLASLHTWKHPVHPETRFGFDHNNYMGSLPQSNTFTSDWPTFFMEHRLQPQVEMAHSQGLLNAAHLATFDNIYKKLPEIFSPTAASLLHGDLWSGNFLYGPDSQPVLIDPAVYYGHPAMDIAMTLLFGGFHETFYEVYEYWAPAAEDDYPDDVDLCSLYPLLIHLNLFGKGYLSDIESRLRRFRQ